MPTTSAPAEALPRKVVVGLSIGHGGMSVLVNLINFLLVFYYLPPDSAGLPPLVADATFLVVLNAVVLIAAAGRFTDAITDPIIALASDRSSHKNGRRIPFMTWAAAPAAIATLLMFIPPVGDVSGWNIVWLLGVQIVLYTALTAYITPAYSLVSDLGRTAEERLDLATATAITWGFGIVFAALTPFLADIFDTAGLSTIRSWQVSIGVVCAAAFVAMMVPTWTIDEPRWSRTEPSSSSLSSAVRSVTANPYFRYYLAADAAYYCGLMIIQTGLLYYLTVLLELDEVLTAPLLLLMIVAAMAMYPIVNRKAKEHSGKELVILAFLLSSVDFLGIIFLGKFPIPTWIQAIVIILIFSVPFAILSVIPLWILSDIAEHSSQTSGDSTAAMFFAVRTFVQKISQTIGVILFALLTSFGRDVGDDLGIRLSGVAGLVLYFIAAVLFRDYDEDKLKAELDSVEFDRSKAQSSLAD